MRRCYVRALFTGPSWEGEPPLPRRYARFLSPVGQAAVRAVLACVPSPQSPERMGIYSATGPSRFDPRTLGARLSAIDPDGELWRGALSQVDPFSLLKTMSASVLAVLGMVLPAEGPSGHFCDDALGGFAALAEARGAILRGALDEAVVVAFDDLSSEHAQAELASGPYEGTHKEIALLHLSASVEGALAEFCGIEIAYDGGGGPVGGAAGLGRLVRALEGAFATGDVVTATGEKVSPFDISIHVDRGRAIARFLPLARPCPP